MPGPCHFRLAIARGFRDFASLHRNRDAELVLSRDEIKTMIMDLDFPARPFAEDR